MQHKQTTILLTLLLLLLLNCGNKTNTKTTKKTSMEENIEEITAEIKNGSAQLLDVREEDEWDDGHLKLAKLAPLSEISKGNIPNYVNRKKKTYLHCRSGRRVLIAEQFLADLGFQEVIPLEEGFDELVSLGMEESE